MNEAAMTQHLSQIADATPPPTEHELRSMARATLARRRADQERLERPHPRRGRRIAVLLVAAAIVVGGMAATATLLIDDPQPPEDIEAAVSELFSNGQCVRATQAADGLRDRLDALGYGDWGITSREGVQPRGCVAAGLVAADKLIVLVPVDGPEVAAAMEAVAQELMNKCLGEEAASQLISSVLTNVGVTDWSIRTDGPLAYPEGQEGAVRQHISAGCFVYSGSGHGPDGPVYYISGLGA